MTVFFLTIFINVGVDVHDKVGFFVLEKNIQKLIVFRDSYVHRNSVYTHAKQVRLWWTIQINVLT